MNGAAGTDPRQLRRERYMMTRSDVGVALGDDEQPYLYRPRQVLVAGAPERRRDAAQELRDVLVASEQPTTRDMPLGREARSRRGSPPAQPGRIHRLDLEPSLGIERWFLNEGSDPREVAGRLRSSHGVDATVHHVFCGEQFWGGDPADDPTPERDAPPPGPDAGAGVKVAVLDTGIDRAAKRHQSLAGLFPLDDDDVDALDADYNGYLDHEAGHGTYVSGLIMRAAPLATIVPFAVLDTFGVGEEGKIAKAVLAAADQGCQIINLSLGGYTQHDAPPSHFKDVLSRLAGRDVVLVAAAGNANDHRRPFWPAAFAGLDPAGANGLHGNKTPTFDSDRARRGWIAAVAAAGDDAAHSLTGFSNNGPWVTCRAPGTAVSTYVKGTWDPSDTPSGQAPQNFDGVLYARWSGTSFSSAHVAGRVAAAMAPVGGRRLSARDALDKVLSEGDQQTIGAENFVFVP